MSTEVVGTDFFDKAVFFHDTPGLFVDMGENQLNALFLTVLVELFKVMHGGRVNGADTSHTKNETAALFVEGDFQNLIRSAEKEGTTDFINCNVIWYNAQGKAVRIVVLIDIFPAFYFCNVAHTFHKQNRSEQDADLDGNDKIEYDRQNKGADQNDNIALRRGFTEVDKGFDVTHIIGNHKQDRCDNRHRNQGSVGHQDNQDQQKDNRMHHSGDRSASAVFDVCGGSGDGSGGWDAAEQRGGDVSGTLCDQFHIGAVTAVYHAVRNDTGEQGLDCC